MKRIFTLITSIVLATSLLAVPCFAAEPEDLPTPMSSANDLQDPTFLEQLGQLQIQLQDAMPAGGEII